MSKPTNQDELSPTPVMETRHCDPPATIMHHYLVEEAILELQKVTSDPRQQAKRIQQAAMLEAAGVNQGLVEVVLQVASSGRIAAEELTQIQRAGIALKVDRSSPIHASRSSHE